MRRSAALILSVALVFAVLAFSMPATQWQGITPPPKEAGDYAYRRESIVLEGYDAQYMELHYITDRTGRSCSLYLANVRFLPEFSDKNEGGAGLNFDTGRMGFGMTKSTGTVTGAVDGPHVSFLFDSKSGVVFNQEFRLAPFYWNPRFAGASLEMLEISDERLAEIALIFKEIIETEVARHFPQ